MRFAFTLFALALATPAPAEPADALAKLSWMAGGWIEETATATTRETWLPPWAAPWPGSARRTGRAASRALST